MIIIRISDFTNKPFFMRFFRLARAGITRLVARPHGPRFTVLFDGRRMRLRLALLVLLAMTSTMATLARADEPDPPEVAIGERLFLETRFSYAYAARPGQSDPVMQRLLTGNGTIRGPFAGQTMNCRNCHLVDEAANTAGGGMRTYADFARRSPVTARGDGMRIDVRNAMQMVDVVSAQQGSVLLHYDGQFATTADLVRATLTGRNFGWLPREYRQAVAHIAKIIREDDGRGELAQEYGGSYRRVLASADPALPAEFRLPAAYRIDVDHASDDAIVNDVARLIGAYVDQIEFARDVNGHYSGSPYDAFLRANNLPVASRKNESPLTYSRRLRAAVNALVQPKFVEPSTHSFKSHQQPFVFGKLELKGLQLFLAEADAPAAGGKAGNCIACHAAPGFSDFGFHNTGVSQREYDALHGNGAFAKLDIPGLKQRRHEYNRWLPPTPVHPEAKGPYRAVASRDKPGRTDLGLWNVFANPDMPKPQARILARLCENDASLRKTTHCKKDRLLPYTVARFRTPILRDLGHSQPYMHNGQFDTLEQVVAFYLQEADKERQGQLRNGAPELADIRLDSKDLPALTAFLKALNEDYE